jgi:ABC-type lipoprotein export system ATPase subunit
MSSGILSIKDLVKSYTRGKVSVPVLNNLNIEIPLGSFVTLMGPSGSGKSTLLHILAGIDRPDTGKIVLNDKELSLLNEKEITEYRRNKIGIVFQFFNLLPYLSALENVSIPLYLAGIGKREAHEKAEKALISTGLKNRMKHSPSELSGGEQQRVAIARSIVNSPLMILADEPTGNLDSKNADSIIELLESLQREMNITVFIVTHDRELGKRGNLNLKMKDGKIESWET